MGILKNYGVFLFLFFIRITQKQETQLCQNGLCLFLIISSNTWLFLLEPNLFIGWSSKKFMFLCQSELLKKKTIEVQRYKKWWYLFLIFLSETIEQIGTKPGRNVHSMVL
jgi:hypothetical protein